MEATEIIALVNSCRDFHVMPRTGGLLDQDSYFMHMYYKVIEYESIRAQIDKARADMGIGGTRGA